jgi:hypothetical protein
MRQVSGHDLSVLPEMSAANRGLRSRAVKHSKEILSLRRRPGSPTRASRGGVEVRAELLPASPGLACWEEEQRSARFRKLGARFTFFVCAIFRETVYLPTNLTSPSR